MGKKGGSMNSLWRRVSASATLALCGVQVLAADLPQAGTPYMPSWSARLRLQQLSDEAALALTTSHWPLPSSAVLDVLNALSLPASAGHLQTAKRLVIQEIEQQQAKGSIGVQLRTPSDALVGYGENYTPGSSSQVLTPAVQGALGQHLSYAARLGGKFEVSANSLSSTNSGLGTDKAYQLRPEGSAAVLGWRGWNVQAGSQRYWWGPGWQHSMINGSNNPAWTGVGIQRGSTAPSQSSWLRWLGPWNLDIFVAKAQDPLVVSNQAQGFNFSGARLTMKPQPWLELGFSRGMQQGGTGRPSGVGEFIKAFFGQETNYDGLPGQAPDSSGQIAGYDARVRCPQGLGATLGGSCAAYVQIMGEDSAGSALPLPFKFMSLWGFEQSYGQGRYHAFVEYANSSAYSLPWDTKPSFPGYVNGVYNQDYTQGARWAGPSIGSGSKVLTWGWMDLDQRISLRLHTGTIGSSLGAYVPGSNAPHGAFWGLSLNKTLQYKTMTITPEMAYIHLADGQAQASNLKSSARLGLTVQVPLLF
jgi:hypothetical protein